MAGRVALRVDRELCDRLEAVAARRGHSLNEELSAALTEHVEMADALMRDRAEVLARKPVYTRPNVRDERVNREEYL